MQHSSVDRAGCACYNKINGKVWGTVWEPKRGAGAYALSLRILPEMSLPQMPKRVGNHKIFFISPSVREKTEAGAAGGHPAWGEKHSLFRLSPQEEAGTKASGDIIMRKGRDRL